MRFIPERTGPAPGGELNAGPLRQPIVSGDGGSASQPVSLGTALDNLLAKLEQRMNENGITKP